MGSERANGAPLAGLSVVEVAEGVAGPFCGRLLAAFGADVVKIERPPLGDRTRQAEPRIPAAPPSEAGAQFLYLNMGKRGAALDWRTPEGADALRRLTASADILIEDWSAADRERVGADSLGDGAIDVSLTPFGLSGPYRDWKTTPLVSLALGGFLYLSGDEDREPLMIPGSQPEYLAGLHGFAGALLALWERDANGRGGRVETTEIESLAALHQFTTVMHTYNGLVRSRHGARWENKGAYGRYPITILPCKDGYVSFAVSTEGQWDTLFPMVGRPELLDDPRFATFVERREHADDIDAILIDWMRDKTRREVFETAAGVWSEPASPLLDLSEVLSDGQLRHRRLFAEIDHPDAGALVYPTVPFRMSATPPKFRRAPRFGEHTAEILDGASKSAPAKPRVLAQTRAESEPAILSDLRVLDLTRVWAGPLATRILGDFGAEVIKISDPRVPLDRRGGTNNKLNRNKPSLALRLDQEEGREIFLELVAASDLVVENFRPRVMRNFGLTYEDLRRARPDIVMCSMSGFGATGAYRDYPAFGPSVEAMTGLPSMMGYAGGPPRTSSLAFPDLVAALNGVAAIAVALRHRRLTGEGQFIDLALNEGPICQIGEYIAAHSRTGAQPPRAGNAHPDGAPCGAYPAAGDDEWVAVCVSSDEEWSRLRALLAADGVDAPARRDAQTADAALSRWTRRRDAGEVSSALQKIGVAAGRASKNWQLLADPHLNARGFFVEIEEPDVGAKKYPGQPIRSASLRISDWKPSARLGEHTERVLSALLGKDPARIGRLEAREVIGLFHEEEN